MALLTRAAVAACGIVLLGLPGRSALAQADRTPKDTVERGGTIRVIGFFDVDPTCRSNGRTIVTLVTPPHGGRVAVRYGSVKPKFPDTNVRVVCNVRRVPSTDLYYTASPEFSGSDSFTIEQVYPTGYARQTTYTIEVH